MARGGSDVDALNQALKSAKIFEGKQEQQPQQPDLNHKGVDVEEESGAGLEITYFSDVFNDVPVHFQILRLPKQVLSIDLFNPFCLAIILPIDEADHLLRSFSFTNFRQFLRTFGLIQY